MDKNYIIEKAENLSELFKMFPQLSPSLQAEILSVLIGIVRKSERNLLVCNEAQIYDQIFEFLDRIDDPVVADLLIDILTVLTSLTISAPQLKRFLRYLKTENQIWVRRTSNRRRRKCVFFRLEKTRDEIVKHPEKSSLSLRTG